MRIVIEGGDGCGKSTIGKAVSELLGCPLIEFPDDKGYTGPMIREYLSKDWEINSEAKEPADKERCEGTLYFKKNADKDYAALAFQCLQIANRMERMREIKGAENIVLVRYWQSGVVYGSLGGLDRDWLIDVHRPMVQADLNILLDVTEETSLERQKIRGEALERYEGNLDFTKKVNDAYRELWEQKKAYANNELCGGSNWVTVDANEAYDAVSFAVLKAVVAKMNHLLYS